jgi:hypothetical protein
MYRPIVGSLFKLVLAGVEQDALEALGFVSPRQRFREGLHPAQQQSTHVYEPATMNQALCGQSFAGNGCYFMDGIATSWTALLLHGWHCYFMDGTVVSWMALLLHGWDPQSRLQEENLVQNVEIGLTPVAQLAASNWGDPHLWLVWPHEATIPNSKLGCVISR